MGEKERGKERSHFFFIIKYIKKFTKNYKLCTGLFSFIMYINHEMVVLHNHELLHFFLHVAHTHVFLYTHIYICAHV